jgi:hypothetical protein
MTATGQVLCANCGKPLSPVWRDKCGHCGVPMYVARPPAPPTTAVAYQGPPPTSVRVYRGNQEEALYAFQQDAAYMAQFGYYAMNQQYVPGSWGAGAYIVGVLLILLWGIGLLVLGYLIIVKPKGTLTVMYARQGMVPTMPGYAG